jgi:hypothetical protein
MAPGIKYLNYLFIEGHLDLDVELTALFVSYHAVAELSDI